MTRIETLCIVHKHPKILLGIKKRRFGKDKYNGFGGGVEKEESIIDAAIRETKEEASIVVKDPKKVGEILFQFENGEQDHLVHIFKAEEYEGEPQETSEMTTEWFHINEIPYSKMWEDDAHWMPLFLKGKKFRGNFLFSAENKIKKFELNEIENFSS